MICKYKRAIQEFVQADRDNESTLSGETVTLTNPSSHMNSTPSTALKTNNDFESEKTVPKMLDESRIPVEFSPQNVLNVHGLGFESRIPETSTPQNVFNYHGLGPRSMSLPNVTTISRINAPSMIRQPIDYVNDFFMPMYEDVSIPDQPEDSMDIPHSPPLKDRLRHGTMAQRQDDNFI